MNLFYSKQEKARERAFGLRAIEVNPQTESAIEGKITSNLELLAFCKHALITQSNSLEIDKPIFNIYVLIDDIAWTKRCRFFIIDDHRLSDEIDQNSSYLLAGMTRKEQKERTREHLLQTAYQEFAKKGFLATKTLDIAKAAGVSHGTLFVHFPTRDALLFQVIEDFGLKLGQRFQQLAAQKQGVKATLEGHIAMIKDDESFYAQLVIEGPLLPQIARYKIFLIQSGIAAYLEKAAKIDSDKGIIRQMPLHLMLNTWMGLLHYYLINRDLFAPGQSVLDTCGQELVNHFMNCISQSKP